MVETDIAMTDEIREKLFDRLAGFPAWNGYGCAHCSTDGMTLDGHLHALTELDSKRMGGLLFAKSTCSFCGNSWHCAIGDHAQLDLAA